MGEDERDPLGRLREILEREKAEYELLRNEKFLRSAEEGARAWGIEIGRTAPALILSDGRDPCVLVACGAGGRVDLFRLAELWDRPGLRMARGSELRRLGLIPGVIPLVGLPLPHGIDEGLFRHESVYGGTGHPEWTLRIPPRELLRLNPGAVRLSVPYGPAARMP
jgi:prolyl-tRNA editing enzyme YbaK/EbsC (Cys-tRNA(Pro) deacylase)